LCHRNEPSGALAGLMRLRAFTQDDAHIFCRADQVVGEVATFCTLLFSVYAAFGFENIDVGLSLRPEVRAGEDAVWDQAEAALAAAARAAKIDYRRQPGEGAFYGPKLDFTLRDKRGRAWQCGTIQLDMVLPERLDAAFVDAGGARVRPVMLHHAVLGSLERFIAILLEHHEGRLPLWLAPDQVVVASVTDAQADHARACAQALRGAGLRAVADVRSERIARKSAEARAGAVPVFCAIGAREAADGTLSLRLWESPAEVMTIDGAITRLTSEIANESQSSAASLDNSDAACDAHFIGREEGEAS
jgi:threonyl-tRNA synthetase